MSNKCTDPGYFNEVSHGNSARVLPYCKEIHGSRTCYYLGHTWCSDEFRHAFCCRCELPDDADYFYPTHEWIWILRSKFWWVEHWWHFKRPRMVSWCQDQECMARYNMPEKLFGIRIADHSKCEGIPF